MHQNNYDFSKEAQIQGFIRSVVDQRSASIEAETNYYLTLFPSAKDELHAEYYKADGSMAVFHKQDKILHYPPVRVEDNEVVFEFQRIWELG